MGLKSTLHNLKEKYKGQKMAPAFNALHTFLYLPNEVTHGGTHIKAADDLKRTMNTVILSLVPCLIFGMFNAGYQHYRAIDIANGIVREVSLFGNFITVTLFSYMSNKNSVRLTTYFLNRLLGVSFILHNFS